MGYWKRARSWASAHTKTYSLRKAFPPILAAVVQYFLFRMRAMRETAVIVATVIGGYVLCYWIEFAGNLLLAAPRAIYKEQHEETDRLGREIAKLQIRPYDTALASEVAVRVEKITDDAKTLLKFLVFRGEVEEDVIITTSGLAPDRARNAIAVSHQHGLIKDRWEGQPGVKVCHNWQIPNDFAPVLKDLLFEPPKAPRRDL